MYELINFLFYRCRSICLSAGRRPDLEMKLEKLSFQSKSMSSDSHLDRVAYAHISDVHIYIDAGISILAISLFLSTVFGLMGIFRPPFFSFIRLCLLPSISFLFC